MFEISDEMGNQIRKIIKLLYIVDKNQTLIKDFKYIYYSRCRKTYEPSVVALHILIFYHSYNPDLSFHFLSIQKYFFISGSCLKLLICISF